MFGGYGHTLHLYASHYEGLITQLSRLARIRKKKKIVELLLKFSGAARPSLAPEYSCTHTDRYPPHHHHHPRLSRRRLYYAQEPLSGENAALPGSGGRARGRRGVCCILRLQLMISVFLGVDILAPPFKPAAPPPPLFRTSPGGSSRGAYF